MPRNQPHRPQHQKRPHRPHKPPFKKRGYEGPIKKISNNEWEIPHNSKQGMQVPVRIFANQRILSKLKTDRTILQGIDVSKLPGIYKYAMILPDGHEGYGFPIGGAAAIDIENGVLSPGGIGFDINCLDADTKILTELGYSRTFREIEQNLNVHMAQVNGQWQISFQSLGLNLVTLKKREMSYSPAQAFMRKNLDNRMLKIKTRTGLSIRCSEDHPIFTGTNFVQSRFLGEGNKIAVNYFDGCKYDPLENHVHEKFSEEHLGIFAKIFGYILGDGTLTASGKKKRVMAFGEMSDLRLMQKDIKQLGFRSSVFDRGKRKSVLKTQYGAQEITGGGVELHIYSQEFAQIMLDLGMPLGRKASQDFLVPEWIMQSPMWIKRLFLAGFFGAELTTPGTHTKTGFYAPILGQNKNEKNKQSCREFMIQIMQLLEVFDVRVTKIAERKEY
ncbi:MAG: RtcB family protein, partial [Candidatus Ranarchaeia archaeon]